MTMEQLLEKISSPDCTDKDLKTALQFLKDFDIAFDSDQLKETDVANQLRGKLGDFKLFDDEDAA